MKNLTLSLSNEPKALYLKIADAIRGAIRKGHILPGERILSTRELAKVLQSHRHTVMNALNELVAEGWIIATQREGYRVCDSLPTLYLDNTLQGKKRSRPSIRFHGNLPALLLLRKIQNQ